MLVHWVVCFLFVQSICMLCGSLIECLTGFSMVQGNVVILETEQTLLLVANTPDSSPVAGFLLGLPTLAGQTVLFGACVSVLRGWFVEDVLMIMFLFVAGQY